MGHWTIVLGNALEGFPCQVQPVKIRVMPLKRGHNPNRLCVMIKPTKGCHQPIKRFFSGMTERRMTQIVCQRNRFGQLAIEAQNTGNGPRHLRHFD